MKVLLALLLICEVWAMKSGLHLLDKSIIVSSYGMNMSFEPNNWSCSKSLGYLAPAGPTVGVKSFQIAQTFKIANPLHSSTILLLPVLAGFSRKCLLRTASDTHHFLYSQSIQVSFRVISFSTSSVCSHKNANMTSSIQVLFFFHEMTITHEGVGCWAVVGCLLWSVTVDKMSDQNLPGLQPKINELESYP